MCQLRNALAVAVVEEDDKRHQQQLQQPVTEQPHEGERHLAGRFQRSL